MTGVSSWVIFWSQNSCKTHHWTGRNLEFVVIFQEFNLGISIEEPRPGDGDSSFLSAVSHESRGGRQSAWEALLACIKVAWKDEVSILDTSKGSLASVKHTLLIFSKNADWIRYHRYRIPPKKYLLVGLTCKAMERERGLTCFSRVFFFTSWSRSQARRCLQNCYVLKYHWAPEQWRRSRLRTWVPELEGIVPWNNQAKVMEHVQEFFWGSSSIQEDCNCYIYIAIVTYTILIDKVCLKFKDTNFWFYPRSPLT